MQSYISNVFITGIMSEWGMSMIEDNLATPRVPSLVQAWIESSKHGQEEKSQNMINVQLAHKKSKIEHRSSVGSHHLCFPMCTLETLQKYCSTVSLLLTFC